MKSGGNNPQGLYNEVGYLRAVKIHGIYLELDAANHFTREIYDGVLEDLGSEAETVADTLENSMAKICIEKEMMTYFISVGTRLLK